MIIWLASFPRSGNTLLRLLLKTVFERDTYSKSDDLTDIGGDPAVAAEVGHRFLGAPWPQAYQTMSAGEESFLVKTHDVPEDAGKAIYIVRDGRSACRSLDQYLKDYPPLGLQYTLRDIVLGLTLFGSWGSHLDVWDPQTRPNTLLVKYEDLVEKPEQEIARIAQFTGFSPVHPWTNEFEKLHGLNAKFFRAGQKNNPAQALQGEELELFWEENGDWMSRLGYGENPVSDLRAGKESRRYLSEKGKQFWEVSERLYVSAGKQAELYGLLESERTATNQLSIQMTEKVRQSELLERQLKDEQSRFVVLKESLEQRLASTERELEIQWTKTAELQQSLCEAHAETEDAKRQTLAVSTQRDTDIAELLDAHHKLTARLHVLLSSRFLNLGWKLGFGKPPYWMEPSQDELMEVAARFQRQLDNHKAGCEPQGDNDLDAEMGRAIQHLFDKGFRPKDVLDIGAAKGFWTQKTAWRWPDAKFFMIDPLQENEAHLKAMCSDPRFSYVLTAVGKEPGELVMNMTPDLDGSSLLAFPKPNPERMRRVPIATVDSLLAGGKIQPPDLVKIDVQGFEINVMDGGQQMFQSAEVFILEVNLISFMVNCPRVHEVVKYMADRKFYLFDVAGSLRRPFENDLGQMDFVFVSEKSLMTRSNRWF